MAKTTEISVEDVVNVAHGIGVVLSQKAIIQILNEFESEADADPTATWNLVVENMIYSQRQKLT